MCEQYDANDIGERAKARLDASSRWSSMTFSPSREDVGHAVGHAIPFSRYLYPS